MTTRSVFYGWWVVAAFSCMTFTSTGIRHAVGPFLKPIVADLGLDRASFSIVIAVSLFLYGLFGLIVGWALDRFGVRATALSLLGSASMTGMSVLVPVVTWLILTTGWRTTYMLIAVGVLVGMLPLSLWVIRESPESMGLTMEGAGPAPK